MPKTLNPEEKRKNTLPEDEEDTNFSQSKIASPKLDEQGKPTQKAVKNAKHAHAIAKAHKQKAEEGRLKTAATVVSLYDGQAPYPDAVMETQDWRNNYSTHFLASIVDRVKPQLKDPLESAPTLTHSKLPDSVEDGARKSQVFQKEITELIRAWPGWSDLLDGITQENVMFGCSTPAWIDDDWRPRLFSFAEAYLPKGAGQHAAMLQTAVFTQRLLIHDFLDLFKNQTAARIAKYNISECIKAANGVISGSTDETELDRLSTLRETGTLGYAYENDDKTVDLYHVLVREYDGGVDLWTVTQDKGAEIRHVENLHPDMEAAVTLFTIQTGNRKLYGSKGLARVLANIHIAIERGRNLGGDLLFLSGLVLTQADKADMLAFAPQVRHPYAILPKSYEISKEQFKFDMDAWERMDSKLVSIAESLAGAFIPPQVDKTGTSNTKIEAAQRALREQAVAHGVLGRFTGQAFNLVWAIQRKQCNKTNLKEAVRIFKSKRKKEEKGTVVLLKKVWDIVSGIFGKEDQVEAQEETKLGDSEATASIIRMLEEGVSPQEIATLALTPAKSDENDEEQTKDQSTVEFISANAAHPMQDQAAAYEMLGEIMIGKDRTSRLQIKDQDPNVRAVAIRDQIIEFSEMLDGEAMPVASIDNHPIHREVLGQKLQELLPAVINMPTPALLKAAMLSVDHLQGHLEMDPKIPPADLKAQLGELDNVRKALEQAAKVLAELAATQPGVPPDQIPPQVNGAPLAAAGLPPTQNVPATEDEREDARTLTDITLKAQEQNRLQEELDFKREQHEHKVAMDTVHATAETAKSVSDASRAAMKEGESDAAQDVIQTQQQP